MWFTINITDTENLKSVFSVTRPEYISLKGKMTTGI